MSDVAWYHYEFLLTSMLQAEREAALLGVHEDIILKIDLAQMNRIRSLVRVRIAEIDSREALHQKLKGSIP